MLNKAEVRKVLEQHLEKFNSMDAKLEDVRDYKMLVSKPVTTGLMSIAIDINNGIVAVGDFIGTTDFGKELVCIDPHGIKYYVLNDTTISSIMHRYEEEVEFAESDNHKAAYTLVYKYFVENAFALSQNRAFDSTKLCTLKINDLELRSNDGKLFLRNKNGLDVFKQEVRSLLMSHRLKNKLTDRSYIHMLCMQSFGFIAGISYEY